MTERVEVCQTEFYGNSFIAQLLLKFGKPIVRDADSKEIQLGSRAGGSPGGQHAGYPELPAKAS